MSDNQNIERSANWVVKPRSNMMHVLPERVFMPALCGMVPPGKGMTPGKWYLCNEEDFVKVIEGKEKTRYSICPKCLKKLRENNLMGGAA